MSIRRIDNIGIAVSDVALVAAFFADRVGLPVERQLDGDPPTAVVTLADAYLYVFETSGEPPGAAREPSLLANRPGVDHISFTVDDVDAAYAELSARGVPFLAEPSTDEAWGIRLAPFRDPEDNLYFLVAAAG